MNLFSNKQVFSFDSDRKRQSVLVSDGHNYKLLIKGADSSILPLLSKKRNHPYLIETQMYLK
jgi:magnesium-transporting ATPase (P-type)